MWISPQVLTVLAIIVVLYIAWFFYRMSKGDVIPLKPGFKGESQFFVLLFLSIAAWLIWSLL
jgi:hypothetical protein